MAQLILPMGVDDTPGLNNFLDTPNRKLLQYLLEMLSMHAAGSAEQWSALYIWGERSAGKSHLLSALAERVRQVGGRVARVETELDELNANEFGHRAGIYLLDDVELLLGDAAGERALLTMLESLRQSNVMLVVTGGRSVATLNMALPDLASRLQAFQQFQLLALDDEEKREVLRQRANQRGIVLSEEVLNWLFTHTGRELGMLLELLERIDTFSLEHKRKVTIPLIRSILEGP